MSLLRTKTQCSPFTSESDKRKWEYFATLKASAEAINKYSLGHLKVNGRGFLKSILQAKKANVESEITEIGNVSVLRPQMKQLAKTNMHCSDNTAGISLRTVESSNLHSTGI